MLRFVFNVPAAGLALALELVAAIPDADLIEVEVAEDVL